MPKKKSSGGGDERGRTRNWNFILYPESAPEGWRDIISETHIEWVCSPIHDKDLNPTGEPKKPHYHVTLLYPGPKTYEQVAELTASLNATIPQKCQSVKGSIRYMAHKDNPEKVPYDWADIKCYNGADLDSLCAPTATERLQIQLDILAYIDRENVLEFSTAVKYARKEGLTDWFNVMMNHSTMSINTYITSRRHRAECRGDIIVDTKSGEIIAELLES